MTALFPSSIVCHRLLILIALAIPSCNGSEGDNLVTGPVYPSKCGENIDYGSLRTLSNAPGTDTLATFEQELTTASPIPVALQCLEWEYADGHVELIASNFSGGCSIEWDGQTVLRAPGDIAIELGNSSCLQTGCFPCTYDAVAEIAVPLDELLNPNDDQFSVSLELKDCEGEVVSLHVWDFSFTPQARGLACKPVYDWVGDFNGATLAETYSETQLNLYAQCVRGRRPRDRVHRGSKLLDGVCVPACTTDADCPLNGALVCQNGACLLPQ